MPEYKTEDRGVLFSNRKRRDEKDAQWTGNAEVKCVHCGGVGRYFVNAWERVGEKAGKYFSLTLKPMRAQQQAPNDRNEKEIPF